MLRRFNYTKRKSITRKMIQISLAENAGDEYSFTADMDLGDLDAPDDAFVVIEAYHGTYFARFFFGTIGQIEPPSNTDLSAPGHIHRVKFRVKVVEPKTRRIIASVYGIRPVQVGSEDSDESKQGLIRIRFDDLGEQLWYLDIDSDDISLSFNREVAQIESKVKTDPYIICTVYPSVLREILTYLFFIEQMYQEDAYGWQEDWIEFVESELGLEYPLKPQEDISTHELLKFIDDAVRVFCSLHSKYWDKLKG